MRYLKLMLFFCLAALFGGCTVLSVTKGRMLRTPVDYRYKEFSDSLSKKVYRIAIDDEIDLQMYANDGYSFVTLSSLGTAGAAGGSTVARSYKVRGDSTIKVPIIGRVKVVGYSADELEKYFEERLEAYFQSPFVIAKIQNRRVYVFSGISGAFVYQLTNQNTTLFEVLASIGGIQQGGNASKIKIIRGDLANPDIYLIDLSTIGGMQEANLTMQAGDIIYIDPFINWANTITSDVLNALGVISTALLVYSLFQ